MALGATPSFSCVCIGALLMSSSAPAAGQERYDTDLELVLAVDVSKSMNEEELLLQRRGYTEAFRSPEIIKAITSGIHGNISVLYLEWASRGHARTTVPWMTIDSAESARRFAERLERQDLVRVDRTSISNALKIAGKEIESNEFNGIRRVIDISGDGPNNQGERVSAVRDRLVGAGIVINGLPLMISDVVGGFGIENLDEYYKKCVIGGPGSFVIAVTDLKQFHGAIKRKLYLEIAGRKAKPDVVSVQFQDAGDGPDCLVGEKIWRNFMERYNFNTD